MCLERMSLAIPSRHNVCVSSETLGLLFFFSHVYALSILFLLDILSIRFIYYAFGFPLHFL